MGLLGWLRVLVSIHALLAESDGVHYDNYNLHCVVSIHALLAESDNTVNFAHDAQAMFLSTLSLRRATVHYDNYNLHCVVSIHALLAESDARRASRQQPAGVSIHALLAESDEPPRVTREPTTSFYPRSPCGERLPNQRQINQKRRFYPRSPCGERLIIRQHSEPDSGVSIHALLAESDA